MSQNPLFEALLWTYTNVKSLNADIVKDWILHAPQYYAQWWRKLYQETPQHILIETGLLCFIIWLMFFKKTADPSKTDKKPKFTEKEIEWLVETWTPEPLVPPLTSKEKIILDDEVVCVNHIYVDYDN